jgi:uncharacterized membrane protein YhaH (DUF805 family)
MDFNLKHLITWKGEMTRRPYLIWGSLLFALKYNLDRLVASLFDRRWYITDYFVQADRLTVEQLSESDLRFYLVLLLLSLPFIWFGTALCLKRLRNAKLPGWLVIFFFLPFINFILFLILSAIPERSEDSSEKELFFARVIPRSRQGSAMFAVAVVSIISLAITLLLVNYLRDYGWSIFVGIPFFLGFGSVLIYGHHRQLRFREAAGVTLTSVFFFGLFIFILAMEGIICIAMAIPIFVPVALLGAAVGYALHNRQQTASLNVFMLPVLVIPATGVMEHIVNPNPPLIHVTTEIIIDAPKQEVWNELVAFSHIDEPAEWLFKTGIAYPIHAEIDGTGVGAIRKCNFTTGPFIEPITIWDEPNVLEFGVLDQPPPMVEWTIYKELNIPHLDGYFKSVKGQFKLETLPDGKTRLLGTTWYHHNIWPSSYWTLMSDFILHRIHKRVLNHIKVEAEGRSGTETQ